MMALTASTTMQIMMEIARRTSAWVDEMWCFSLCLFFENNALGRRPLWCVVELLPKEKPFPDNGKVWKKIFCARIIVIFLYNVYSYREVFSLMIMGDGKQVLSVLQWLEVVIAFVSSLEIISVQFQFQYLHHFSNSFVIDNIRTQSSA